MVRVAHINNLLTSSLFIYSLNIPNECCENLVNVVIHTRYQLIKRNEWRVVQHRQHSTNDAECKEKQSQDDITTLCISDVLIY